MQATPDFGSREFWEANALAPKDEYVEWFAGYAELANVLRSACTPGSTVLHAGCGISSLSQALYDDGFRHQVAVDFSEQCMLRQRELCGPSRPEMGNAVMDCTRLGLRLASVDVCIDKGTLDALLCIDEGSEEAVAAMADEVRRVLRPDGLWLIISFNAPSTVVPVVEACHAAALVACHALHSGNGVLYVYSCKLGPDEPAGAGADARSASPHLRTAPLPPAHAASPCLCSAPSLPARCIDEPAPLRVCTLTPSHSPLPLTLTLTAASAHRGWLRAVHGRHALLLETRARDCHAWDQEGRGAEGGTAEGAGSGSGAGSEAGNAIGPVKAEGGAEAEAELKGAQAELLPLLLELRLLPDAAGPLPGAAPLDPPSLDALSLDAISPSPPSPPLPPLGSPAHLRSLVVLQLQGLRLSALPCSDALLRGLTGLRTLDCRRNRLCALPAALGSLGALESLLLDRNGLEALPEELGQLTALRTLSATHNGLVVLPPSWRRLANLRTLRLQSNPLGAPQLAQLEQCTRLRYSGSGPVGGSDVEGVGALCVASIDERQAAVLREQRDGSDH
jgi:hypothetical protein